MGGNNADDSIGDEGNINKSKGFFRRRGGGLFSRAGGPAKSSSSSPSSPSSSSPPPPSRGGLSSSSPLIRRIRGATAGQQQHAVVVAANKSNNNNNNNVPAQSSSSDNRKYYYFNKNRNNNKSISPSSPINSNDSFHSAAETKKDADKKHGGKSSSSSWLCRTKYFRQMCDAAFETIDLDESGTVDEKELYSGLLLIHLKLGMYAGPAACKPLGRERCSVIFHQMDADNSGCLDKDEFVEVMMLLFSNVLFRVMVQWSMTLMIVPLIAQKVLNGIYATIEYLYFVFITLDEHSTIANRIELTVEAVGAWIYQRMIPETVLNVAAKAHYYLDKIPDAVWNSIPLTLISTILGILVVPYCILKVDDFFQYLAQRSDAKTNNKKKSSAPPATKAAKQS